MSDVLTNCAINYTDKANYDADGVDKSMIIMIMMIIDSDFVVALALAQHWPSKHRFID